MFASPSKVGDRWIGQESLVLHDGLISSLAYTFRVLDESISKEQRESAARVLEKYEKLWEKIRPKIESRFSLNDLSGRLLLYVPGVVGRDEYEYLLGYEFEENSSLCCAFLRV